MKITGCKYCLLFLLLSAGPPAFAQTPRIDSLKKALSSAGSAHRPTILLALCEEANSMNADSLYAFALEAYENSSSLAKGQFFQPEYYITRSLLKRGLLDSAYNQTVAALNHLNDKGLSHIRSYRMFLATRANLLIRKNEFKEAITQFDSLLRNAESNNDFEFQAVAMNGIGWAYMEMNRNRDALKWFHDALKNTGPEKTERYSVILLSNMAAVFNTIGRQDSALYYISRAMELATKYQDLTSQANALNIEASIYIDAGQNEKAEQPLNRALEIRKKVSDPFYIVSDIAQLASYYAHNDKPEKGIALCLQGIELAKKYALNSKLRLLYNALAENYKAAGDMENYSATLEKILALNDSLYSRNTTADLASIHANYELQKKENIIIRQKLDIIKKDYLFYGSLGLLLITGFFSLIIFRNYRRKQKMKINLLIEEEKRLMEDAVREAEENERKRIAADLHDNLGVYAAAIASNVDAAMRSGGDNEMAMTELKTNSQAMVAQLGDTIWVLKKDSLSLTAISDRVKIFMQRMQASYPTFNIEVQEQIENDLLLTPSQAYHLFCIIQEGVNNAVKHSGGNEAHVLIENKLNWRVQISDNGSGFNYTAASDGHNGLHNMQSRATANKWNIEWKKPETGGTTIIIYPQGPNK